MTTPSLASNSLLLGQPRFKSHALQSTLLDQGPQAAWTEALKQGPQAAAAGVDGDFAVALTLADNQGFMALDRFATQTLCYRVVNGQLRFAAGAKDLADAGSEIDPQAIYDYLYFHCIPSPRTIYKGVFRLPPGHYAWFSKGVLEVKPFWTPEFKEPATASFDALKPQFLSLLEQSVTHQFDGSKAACFLSGGTDSSTVAGMLMRVAGQQVHSYSIGFDAEGYDEMAYARLASRHFGTAHHEYYVTPADLVRSIPAMGAHLDQPFGNSSVLPAYYCAKMAREDGVTRLLAGDGGDELFGGNARYAKQKVFDLYQQIPAVLRSTVLEPLLAGGASSGLALRRKAASYIEQARMPMPDRLQLYNLITRVGPAEVLSPDFCALLDFDAPLAHQQAAWAAAGPCAKLNRMLAFDWRYTLAESDLPKVRAATSLAGIEVGFPMLDDGLLDFSLGLPLDYKLRGQKLRWFFKEALRGFLPDEILAKPKQGFGLPFGVWTTKTPALKKLAEESLHALADRGIVRRDYLHTLMTEQLPSYPGYYGEMVWILMMLEQWLRAHAPNYRV